MMSTAGYMLHERDSNEMAKIVTIQETDLNFGRRKT
jgi:hypothetical protein